jgi:hemoglobin
MIHKKDIQNIDDIKILVDGFYSKIREDELLAPVFIAVISDDWQPHLDKMYLFWNAALFGIRGYVGNPFLKHSTLPIRLELISRWLLLFNETCEEHFFGEITENAKWRASIMAEVFLTKIGSNVKNQTKSVL